jgi:hypothetical protein
MTLAALGQAHESTAQQAAPLPLVMVTETLVRPDMVEQFHQFRLATAQIHARANRPYPYTVATEDRGAYVFVTRGFSDLTDWERWSDVNASLPAVPGGPRIPDAYSQVAWYMQERPEWSYIPDSPRVRREDAGFVHWDVYYGRGPMIRWGMPADESERLGYLANAQLFPKLIELHRSLLPTEGFAVYTTYATGHPRHGASVIIETWAESERDYYSRLAPNQMALGIEGHRLLVGLLGNSSGMQDYDLSVIPELSHRVR